MNNSSLAGIAKKKILLLVLPVVALAGGGWWMWYQNQPHYKEMKVYKATTKWVKVQGEVVDAWCYASQTMGPGRGMGHLACATACVGGGVTAGILEDKTEILYIAAKYKGYQGCRELLLPYIGKKVVVYGYVGDLGGNRLLKISSVKLVEPELKPVRKPGANAPASSAGQTSAVEPEQTPAIEQEQTSAVEQGQTPEDAKGQASEASAVKTP
jgi:hypothetical protein